MMADERKPPDEQPADPFREAMARARQAKPGAPPPPTAGSRDPVENLVQGLTAKLDQAGLLPSKGGMLREAGGFLIPQNTPELALAALMALQPEVGLARLGVPLAEKLAATGFLPALARAGMRGLTTAGAGALTGHSPVETGLSGAAGSALGDVAGKAVTAYQQSAAAKLALGDVTKDLAGRFQATIGRWLPQPEEGAAAHSPERIIRSVWNGEASDAVSAELNAIKAKNAHTPVRVIDLQPTMTDAGVVFEAPAAPSKLTPGREMATQRGLAPRGEMPLGDALAAIDKARTHWNTQVGPDKELRLGQLKGFEHELAMRADPHYKDVLKQWGRVQQLQDWLDVEAPSLFDGRTGRLSWDGYAELAQRLGKREPNAGRLSPKSFEPDEIAGFGNAMRLDLERGGMVWGQPGRFPIHGLGFGMTMRPHARVGMPQASWMPGWDAEQSLAAKLARAGFPALAGQAPVHLARDPEETP